MDVLGFVFGLSGMSFALTAWTQVASLRKELEDLKKRLEKPAEPGTR